MSNYTLITGASGGIGWELARLFAADGHPLVLVARNEQRLLERKAALEAEYAVSVVVMAQDLTQPNAAQELFDRTVAAGIAVDTLVNNAGMGDFAAFIDADWQRQQDMIRLNVMALTHLTHCFARGMRELGGGRILNIASIAALSPGPYMATYYATKAFVLSFSEAMHEELAEHGITVTVLCPGPTESNFLNAANMEESAVFKSLPVFTAEKVARAAYKALRRGKAVAFCGGMVRFLSVLVRFTPRWFNRYTTTRMNGKPKGETV